jgi:hypothetical protein
MPRPSCNSDRCVATGADAHRIDVPARLVGFELIPADLDHPTNGRFSQEH